MKTKLRRFIASLLIVSVTGLGLPLPAHAGIVSTDTTIQADRDRIAAMLDRPDVRAQLEARGVNAAGAKARVAALTDEEVAQVAAGIDSLPAGGDPFNTAIFIVAMAVLLVVGGILLVAKLISHVVSSASADAKEKTHDDSRTNPEQEQAPKQ